MPHPLQIAYAGDVPNQFLSIKWEVPPRPLEACPLYELDAAFVFGGRALSAAESTACQLVERSGRPVIRVGVVEVPIYRPAMSNVLMVRTFEAGEWEDYEAWIASRPRTNYRNVACGLYDRLEAAITLRKAVVLVYRTEGGEPASVTTTLLATKTSRSEEYVQLGDQSWMRLDRIQALDGEWQEASCTF